MFLKKVINSSKVRIINNSIDVQKFTFNEQTRHECRNELGLTDKFVVGHVGRFSKEKGHAFLVDAFIEVYNRQKNSVLLLVGDGPLQNEVETKANNLGISDSVVFLGTRNDIPRILMAMDLFVFPSSYESFGIALIEAQAAGLKVLASDTIPRETQATDLLEYLSLKSGVSEWAKIILKCVNGYSRSDTSDNLKSADFDNNAVAATLQEFYLSCVHKEGHIA
jgi:glycosyltransferase involved in cell wall biosynthesis